MQRDILGYKVNKYIGRGKFSLVYEASEVADVGERGRRYALKRVFLQKRTSLRSIWRERSTLVKLASARQQSAFLTRLIRCFKYKKSVVFVQTLASMTSLQHVIMRTGGITNEEWIRFYLCEIMSGLQHLHSLHIVHNDIKPSNVMLAPSGHVVIIDMDCSFDLSRNDPTAFEFATALYCSPESAESHTASPKSDIWGLGITLVFLRFGFGCGLGDYATGRLMLVNASAWIKDTSWEGVSQDLEEIIRACLQHNPDDRLDIEGLKQQRFFSHVSWSDVESLKLTPPYPGVERELKHVAPELALEAAYSDHFPKMRGYQFVAKEAKGLSGCKCLEVEPPFDLEAAGVSKEVCEAALKGIDFLDHTSPQELSPVKQH